MLVIILWHVLGYHSVLTDPWVMPIFFFIAGYFWKPNVSFRGFWGHKLKKLILPLACFSIPAFILLCFKIWHTHDWHPVIKLLSPYDSIICGGWFIPCMLMAYLSYWVADRMFEDEKYRWLIVICFSIIGYTLDNLCIKGHKVVLPFYINTALFVMVFMEVGRLVRLLENRYQVNLFSLLKFRISSVVLFFIALYLLGSKPLDLIWSDYQGAYWGVVVLEGILGICALLSLLSVVKNYPPPPFAYIGRQSLGMLLLHGYVIDLLVVGGVERNICLYLLTVVITLLGVKLIELTIPKILP